MIPLESPKVLEKKVWVLITNSRRCAGTKFLRNISTHRHIHELIAQLKHPGNEAEKQSTSLYKNRKICVTLLDYLLLSQKCIYSFVA